MADLNDKSDENYKNGLFIENTSASSNKVPVSYTTIHRNYFSPRLNFKQSIGLPLKLKKFTNSDQKPKLTVFAVKVLSDKIQY